MGIAFKIIRFALLFVPVLVWAMPQQRELEGATVHITGSLVAKPCSIDPGSLTQEVDMGTIDVDDVYGSATPFVPFEVDLIDCKPELASMVKVTLGGTPEPGIPGNLGVAVTGGATGVGLTFFANGGIPLPVNQESEAFALSGGTSNTIPFDVKLVGTLTAIQDETVTAGDFNATVTLTFGYD